MSSRGLFIGALLALFMASAAAAEPIHLRSGDSLIGPFLVTASSESEPAIIMEGGATLKNVEVLAKAAAPLGAAIVIRGSGNRIENCVITALSGDGILLLKGNLVIDSCIIEGSKNGVHARGGRIEAERSRISGRREAGISLQESSSAVLRVTRLESNPERLLLLGALSEFETDTASAITESGIVRLFPFSSPGASSSTDAAARVLPEENAAFQPSPLFGSLLAPALAEVDFRAEEIRLPADRLILPPEQVREALLHPLDYTGTLVIDARNLLAASTPEEALALWAFPYPTESLEEFAPGELMKFLRERPDASALADAFFGEEISRTLWEDHFAGPEERAASNRLGELAADTRLAAPFAQAAGLLRLIELAAEEAIFDPAATDTISPPPGISGEIVAATRTKAGWLVVGGEEDNVYPPGITFIIDRGGNDRYYDAARADSGIALVIDFSGDDVYEGRTASARNGIAILIDHQGNDRYEGVDFTQASAIGGFAMLWDGEGDDLYEAKKGSQGFAIAGAALLFDSAGNDIYRANSYSQASSGPYGQAWLVDREGDDGYFLDGGTKDALRSGGKSLSFGQGFSMGLRPGASGGTAHLIDGAGNDRYEAGLFTQGGGYWEAAGALTDLGGNDVYRAWQYVQGSGVHLAYGALIDRGEGDDVYHSWSVSQGCGHDLSFGILADEAGDDWYQAYSRAQGMGLTNGIGVILDEAGDDRYLLNLNDQGQGTGWFEPLVRRYGSLGLLLDLEGEDLYSGKGRDHTSWRQDEVGAGVDR